MFSTRFALKNSKSNAMKKMIILAFMFLVGIASAQDTKTSTVPEAFYNCWLASYEEDEANSVKKNYRQCDYGLFPPSRFRQQLTFRKDGTCRVLNLGVTDAHFFTENKWTFNENTKLVVIYDDKGKPFMQFKINYVDKNHLVITHFEITTVETR